MSSVSYLTDIAVGFASGIIGILIGCYVEYKSKPSRADQDLANLHRQWALGSSPLPDLSDHAAVQRFYTCHMGLGSELLATGDWRGVDHIAFAVAVAADLHAILAVLYTALPRDQFTAVILRLPEINPLIGEPGASGDVIEYYDEGIELDHEFDNYE